MRHDTSAAKAMSKAYQVSVVELDHDGILKDILPRRLNVLIDEISWNDLTAHQWKVRVNETGLCKKNEKKDNTKWPK